MSGSGVGLGPLATVGDRLHPDLYSATECHKLGDAAKVAYRMVTGRDDFVRLVGVKPEASRSLSWNPHDEEWLAQKLPCTWQAAPRCSGYLPLTY